MRNLYRSLVVFLFGSFFLSSAVAEVIFVRPGESGSVWNGRSPVYSDLRQALLDAEAGDEIWVAAGTYKPTTGSNRDISFELKEGVKLYGGFVGNETTRDQRDSYRNKTILSGNIGDQSVHTDNSKSVVSANGSSVVITEATIIDGFIIEDGYAPNTWYGGGLYLENASPRVVNVWFRNNHAIMGGAVYGDATSAAVFANVIFSSNSSSSAGGAVYAQGAMTFYHCLWYGNHNAVASSAASLTEDASIYNSIIWGNTSQSGTPVVTAANVAYSIVQGGYDGPGNLDTDPLFHVAENEDFRLNSGSPALETASNALVPLWLTKDIAGSARIQGTADMGPYEGAVKVPVTSKPAQGAVFEATETAFTLEWGWTAAAPANIVSYELEYKINGGSVVSANTAMATSYQLSGVTESGKISWRVAAVDENGNYTWSAWAQFFKKRDHPVYVKPNGMGTGKAWNDATNLQAALADYILGDELWLAAGTYRPTTTSNRNLAFEIREGIKIYGGFIGNESVRDARDWYRNRTILSGDIGVPGNTNDNSRNVLIANGTAMAPITGATIIDGVVIEGGYNSDNNSSGAGILLNWASPTFVNVWFRNNYAYQGGAVYGDSNSQPVFVNSLFTNNSSTRYGGAVRANARMEFANCLFYGNNTGDRGGAVDNASSSTFVAVNNSIAWNNSAGSANPNFYAVEAKNCIVEGGYAGISILSSDPLFLNASANDFRVNLKSPAVDQGNIALLPSGITKDYKGNARVLNALIDLGPFEGGIATPLQVSPADREVVGLDNGKVTLVWEWQSTVPSDIQSYRIEYVVNGGATNLVDGINKINLSYEVSGLYASDGVRWRVAVRTTDNDLYYSPWSEFYIERGHPIYVKPGATGTGNSWSDATDLQTALQLAVFGDELWVAAGVYKPTSGSDRGIAFEIKEGLKLYGGFSGTETSREQRNHLANQSVLSGNIGDPDSNNDNSYHVVIIRGEVSVPVSSATVIDGFIIEKGRASFAFSDNDKGGALIINNGSPLIINTVFRENYAFSGGAVAVLGNSSAPGFGNVVFLANESRDDGGAVYSNAYPEFYNSLWYGNTAGRWGGAVYGQTANRIKVVNSISRNSASQLSGDDIRNASVTASIYLNAAGTGNFDIDPGFVDAEEGDFRVGPYAPVLDKGVEVPEWLETDFAGQPRILNGKTDIGIYEGYLNTVVPESPADGEAAAPEDGLLTLKWKWYDSKPGDVSNYTLLYSLNGGEYEEVTDIAGEEYVLEGLQSLDEVSWRVISIHNDGSRRLGPVSEFKVNRGHPIYVKPNGNGAGTSWDDAASLHEALFMAAETDILWLAAGYYLPVNKYPVDNDDRNVSFELKSGISLIGGFAGTETAIGQRDLLTNRTIITGDIGSPQANADNSYHVLRAIGTPANPLKGIVIDGVTIQLGYSTSNGAGLFVENASLKVVNSKFLENVAATNGGAVSIDAGSEVVFANVIFSGNSSGTAGGAVWAAGNVVFHNCLWYGNHAGYYGGALFAASGQVYNSIFQGNIAPNNPNIYGSTVTYSMIQGGYTGVGNIDANPLLNNPGEGDFMLRKESPAVDNGNAELLPDWLDFDYFGRPRIDGNGLDLGPIEGYIDMDLKAPRPVSPVDGTVLDKETTSVTVEWEWASTQPAGITGYDVEYRVNDDEFQVITDITDMSRVIPDLKPGDEVRWRVRARKATEVLDWSDYFNFSIEESNFIFLPGAEAFDVNIWPNPMPVGGGELNIEVPGTLKHAVLRIYTINGQMLQEHRGLTGNKFTIDIVTLQPGVYLVVIEENGLGVGAEKLIVK